MKTKFKKSFKNITFGLMFLFLFCMNGCERRPIPTGIMLNHNWHLYLAVENEGVEVPCDFNFLVEVFLHGRDIAIGSTFQSEQWIDVIRFNENMDFWLPVSAFINRYETLTVVMVQISEEVYSNETGYRFDGMSLKSDGWIIDDSIFHIVFTHNRNELVEWIETAIYQEIDGELISVNEVRFVNEFGGEVKRGD